MMPPSALPPLARAIDFAAFMMVRNGCFALPSVFTSEPFGETQRSRRRSSRRRRRLPVFFVVLVAVLVRATGSDAPDCRRVDGIDSREHLGERKAATVVEHLPTDVLAHLRQHTLAYVVVEQLPADVWHACEKRWRPSY
jgi:hypothetical protein